MKKKIKVISKKSKADITDKSLNVETFSEYEMINEWSKEIIIEALKKEANVKELLANEIAESVEKKIFKLDVDNISTDMIRSLVDEELLFRGEKRKLLKQKMLGIPTYDLEQTLFDKTMENSNVQSNSPEAINMYIAESVLKQYALNRVFSNDVSMAHFNGVIHLHDLGYITRVYCSSHSLCYILKYGLDLENLTTKSSPAKHAHALTGHLNTFLASMQAYWAGALGIAYVNIFYSPLLVGYSLDQMKKEAQYLIFSCSQNAFSRGGQTLFIDFNLHLGIPKILEDVPALCSGGKYCNEVVIEDCLLDRQSEEFRKKFWILSAEKNIITHDEIEKYYELFPLEYNGSKILDSIKQKKYTVKLLTYKDFEKESQNFALALMDIWQKGDKDGSIFPFPKFQCHIDDNCFLDEEQRKLLDFACEMASDKGLPYFVFDRGDETVLSQCCRLIERVTDVSMIKNPESLRFTGFQNITLNLPQAAFRAKGNLEKTIEEIKWAMDIAMKAHLQKKKFIQNLMDNPSKPLWQIGKISPDGKPYVDLEKATYIMGIVGLNECVEKITGKQLHESEDSYKVGIKIITNVYLYCKELAKQNNLKLVIEESPAESASARLAKIDFSNYPESKNFVKGNKDNGNIYYTNSVHLSADADVDIVERVEKQAKFNSLIEAGAITHIFLGEQKPSKEAIFNFVEKVWRNTISAQITFSPELLICHDCGKISRGFDI
jgi:anaerobic ribonucleoside-triphosphate reductase